MNRHLPAILLLLCLGAATPAPSSGDVLKVVVSIPPQVWLVKAIGGDLVDVEAILGPGDSPATYQPTDAQVTRVLSARVFFRIGVPYEAGSWFRALSVSKRLVIVDGREGVDLLALEGEVSTRDHHGSEDPHVWLSPRRLKVQAETVARALARVDPGHEEAYEEGLDAALETLADLDLQVERILAPFAGRSFLVFHPSWGYFASDYGLRQVALETGGKEPTDRELTETQKMAREEGVGTVFVQPQIRGKSAQAVAQALGAELRILDPLASDLPENLLKVALALAESFEP